MSEWTRPEMLEIKMDAEISSYQEDPDPWRNTPPLRPVAGDSAATTSAPVGNKT